MLQAASRVCTLSIARRSTCIRFGVTSTRVAAIAGLSEEYVRVRRSTLVQRLLSAVLRADRRTDKFARHDRRARVVKVHLELAHEEGMHVAADHNRVRGLRQLLEQPTAGERIAVPAIGPE